MVMQEEIQYSSNVAENGNTNFNELSSNSAAALPEAPVETQQPDDLAQKSMLENKDYSLMPEQQPPVLPKLFDMPEQHQVPNYSQMFPPQDFNVPALSGLNNPNLGGPPFWSSNVPSEDFYNYPPPVNNAFPMPASLATQAQGINPMFSQNLMNLNAQLALSAHNRRSPATLFNAQFNGTRHNPNIYQLKNFPQPTGWQNGSQSNWNALGNQLAPSPWNQLSKRERGPAAAYDSMRFHQIEGSLLDIMRTNEFQPDHSRQQRPYNNRRKAGRQPFFSGGIGMEDFGDQLNTGAHYVPDPMLGVGPAMAAQLAAVQSQYPERFSRKVFVGGLPPDIDEDEITSSFRRFGPLVVDWPHKAESKSYFPPKGYAFLLFQEEASVQELINQCVKDDGKLYLYVSSPTIKEKAVQIRPWNLGDSDYVMDGSQPLDPRKTIFVGGVPRPLKAQELARIMDRLYGCVCYAGIDTDPELKYPKGAGRVAFSNQQSYIAAISARFVQLQHGEIDKRVEVKPYVLDDQMCDECHGQRCNGKYAPYFCANVTCLKYFCDQCWGLMHSRQGREYHKPLVKEGGDRSRQYPVPRWT